jgi:hypothetical protein
MLELDLVRVDLRTVDQFTWIEGGTTPTDPDAVTIEVGNLADGLSIQTGTAVEARGLFAAIDADQEDFEAGAVTNRDLAPSLLVLRDRIGGFTLSPTVSPNRITLALSGSVGPGEAAHVDRGFVGSVDLPQSPSPTVVPPSSGLSLYSIRDRDLGGTEVFLQFEDFAQALAFDLGSGGVIFNLNAIGQYDAGDNQMTARLIGVVID